MAKELFGTDGIRGVPGTCPLDAATLHAAGRALAAYVCRETSSPHVPIGMDTRESGPRIASLLGSGLAQAGVTPAFAGIITTPGVACLVRRKKYQAGVVISASHNPYHDNGVKLFSGAGMKFSDAIEEKIEADILRWKNDSVRDGSFPLLADQSFDAEYLAFLGGCVLPGATLAGLKNVLECAHCPHTQFWPALIR